MLFHRCTKDNKENAIKLKSICPLPLNNNKNNNVLFLKQILLILLHMDILNVFHAIFFSHILNSPLEYISFEA